MENVNASNWYMKDSFCFHVVRLCGGLLHENCVDSKAQHNKNPPTQTWQLFNLEAASSNIKS